VAPALRPPACSPSGSATAPANPASA
jgi:hypothetical protein